VAILKAPTPVRSTQFCLLGRSYTIAHAAVCAPQITESSLQ
jgi:hypothetical protein